MDDGRSVALESALAIARGTLFRCWLGANVGDHDIRGVLGERFEVRGVDRCHDGTAGEVGDSDEERVDCVNRTCPS